MQNWKRPIISLNLSSEMPLVLGTLKSSKTDFHRSQHQKGKNQFGPLQVITFHQPTTVDKEPTVYLLIINCITITIVLCFFHVFHYK